MKSILIETPYDEPPLYVAPPPKTCDMDYRIQTTLTYPVQCRDLNNGGFEKMIRSLANLRGGQINVLGFPYTIDVRILDIDKPGFCEVVIPVEVKGRNCVKKKIKDLTRQSLEDAVQVFIENAGIPYSAKGEYEVVEKVLNKYHKKLLSNVFFFRNGKLVVDMPEEKKLEEQPTPDEERVA